MSLLSVFIFGVVMGVCLMFAITWIAGDAYTHGKKAQQENSKGD